VYCLEELVECVWNNMIGGASMHVCVRVCVLLERAGVRGTT